MITHYITHSVQGHSRLSLRTVKTY